MSSNDASGSLSKIDSKREVYRGRQFSFFVEQVTHPNGVQSEMGVVRHPGSTVIVPVFDDGTIGLIRQYRHAVSEYVYETPAGTMEPDEEPLVCAYRELEEETGFAAGKMIFVGKTYLLPAYSDEVTHVYLARDLRETTQDLDPDEIIDALSILSIYHAAQYIKNASDSHPPTA